MCQWAYRRQQIHRALARPLQLVLACLSTVSTYNVGRALRWLDPLCFAQPPCLLDEASPAAQDIFNGGIAKVHRGVYFT